MWSCLVFPSGKVILSSLYKTGSISSGKDGESSTGRDMFGMHTLLSEIYIDLNANTPPPGTGSDIGTHDPQLVLFGRFKRNNLAAGNVSLWIGFEISNLIILLVHPFCIVLMFEDVNL